MDEPKYVSLSILESMMMQEQQDNKKKIINNCMYLRYFIQFLKLLFMGSILGQIFVIQEF